MKRHTFTVTITLESTGMDPVGVIGGFLKDVQDMHDSSYEVAEVRVEPLSPDALVEKLETLADDIRTLALRNGKSATAFEAIGLTQAVVHLRRVLAELRAKTRIENFQRVRDVESAASFLVTALDEEKARSSTGALSIGDTSHAALQDLKKALR